MEDADRLKLYLDNSSTTIHGKLGGDKYKAFKEALGYYPEDAMWRQQNNPHWDGLVTTVCYNRGYCRCSVKKDGMHFPTGLVSKAVAFFKENEIGYEFMDCRHEWAKQEIGLSLSPISLSDGTPFSLYDYQEDAVTKAVDVERGIVKIATGGGKTKTAAGIIARVGVTPSIFYVTSKELLLQAVADLEEVLLKDGKPIKVGQVGCGRKSMGDITVMTVQTAVRAVGEKYIKFDEEDEQDATDIEDIKKELADLIRSAKLIICDEVQHWRAETCQVIADNSLSCRWRYGLSATPYRDAGDDILIEACFGRKIVDINASWLIHHGYLVKPYISFIPIKNMKGENLGPYPSVYKAALVENAYRNELIAKLAQNLVGMDRTTLVLVQQIHHGELLEELIPGAVFMHGSSTDKKRKEHIKLIKSGKAPITISSTIFDEGIDCKPLDALILAGGGKSPTRALQRIGRVIRKYTYPGGRVKDNAFVYDFRDHQKYLSQHALARHKIYMTEPEFDIKEHNG